MSTKVVTGLVRLSYAHLFEPRANDKGVKKYGAAIIIPKSDTVTVNAIKKAIEEAKELGKTSKWGGKIPGEMKAVLRDGDIARPDDPAYKNSYFINANANEDKPPVILDKGRNPIFNKSEVYSGCYGRVSLNFYPFYVKDQGAKGIGVGLNAFQKYQDGEPLGTVFNADEDFGTELILDEDLS